MATSLLLLLLLVLLSPPPAVFTISEAEVIFKTTTTVPQPDDPLSDTDVLAMFQRVADAHGILRANWTTSNACSGMWRGVRCTSGRVTSLLLPSLDLRGPLDPIAHLHQLRHLDLHDNRLNGTLLPLLSSLRNLKLLYLSRNDIAGDIPSSAIGRLTRLTRVDLSDNNLQGPIPQPDALRNLTRILTLRLQNNLLGGSLPDLSEALPRLVEFNVSNNALSGEVPDAMLAKFGTTSFVGNAGLCGPKTLVALCSSVTPPQNPSSRTSTTSAASSQSVVPSSPNSITTANGGLNAGGVRIIKTGGLSTGAVVGIATANSLFLLIVLSLLVAYCCCTTKDNMVERGDKMSKVGDALESDGEQEEGKAGRRHSDGSEASDEGHCNKLVFFEEDEEEDDDDREEASDSSAGGKRGGFKTERSQRRDGGSWGRRRSGVMSKRFELEELLRASAEMLGKGTFGTVYRAVLEGGSMVAVKRLRDGNPCPSRNFHRYMELIGRLRHPNLVRLRAYYYATQEKLLIYDYLPNASLYFVLHGNRGPGRMPLDWTTRVTLVLGAARGLARIHEGYSSCKIPHGNVKSSNVLIDKNGVACLSDFGLALLIDPAHAVARMGGYKAPEQVRTKRLSQEADVYSFGVLILEVLTGKVPTTQGSPPAHPPVARRGLSLPEWVRSVVREKWKAEVFDAELLRYKNVEEEMIAMLHLGLLCVSERPEQRPSMTEVVKMIEDIRVEQSPIPEEDDEGEEDAAAAAAARISLSSSAATTEDPRINY